MSRRTWFVAWLLTTVLTLNAVILLWQRRLRLTLTGSLAEQSEPVVNPPAPLNLEAETPPAVMAAPAAEQATITLNAAGRCRWIIPCSCWPACCFLRHA